jgi:hypothetical protein
MATTNNNLALKTTPCDTCAADKTECFKVGGAQACGPCMKRCSFLEGKDLIYSNNFFKDADGVS